MKPAGPAAPGSTDAVVVRDPAAGSLQPLPTPAGTGLWIRRLAGLALGILLLLAFFWPPPAWGEDSLVQGAQLFQAHCVGCHVNGGNVIRRGRTLRRAALERQGLGDAEAIARVATAGIGQMGGYGAVLGEEGARAVGLWVWNQALAEWPKARG